MNDWLYGWAMIMTVAAVGAVLVAWWAMKHDCYWFTPQEQMRERTPWPPPPLPSQTVTVTYRRQEQELLALPRGDQ